MEIFWALRYASKRATMSQTERANGDGQDFMQENGKVKVYNAATHNLAEAEEDSAYEDQQKKNAFLR